MGANYFALFSLLLFTVALKQVTCTSSYDQFRRCMEKAGLKIQEHLFPPTSPKFPSLFFDAQQNARWLNSSIPISKPVVIVTPSTLPETQAAVLCSKQKGLLVRVKSGGHDYENLSFIATEPYIMIDMVNQRNIDINLTDQSAWVQTGANLGELYVRIAEKSPILAFPGGTCPSVGTGGLISGGGFGMLARKYGLAADNVLDAQIIIANGKILDRKSMGEDLFWAIRGGGGASFGVIRAWKLRLVQVPEIITVFDKKITTKEGLVKIVHKWQDIAPKLPQELLTRVVMRYSAKTNETEGRFNSQFLGTKSELIPLMNNVFPELRLQEQDCQEMSWIDATIVIGRRANKPLSAFLNRSIGPRGNSKAKSDFVNQLMPETAIQELFDKFLSKPGYISYMIFEPYGGIMDKFSESALPFPHRKGTVYNIQYNLGWKVNSDTEREMSFRRINEVYKYMETYVSRAPRAAYINYRDLEIGSNRQIGHTSYAEARVWGEKYFKGNFYRLAQVKSKVDPENFFRSQQSIPTLHH